MSTLILNILPIPTYNVETLMIVDASTYPETPINPTIEITPPGFNVAIISFNINDFNIFTTANLGITATGINQPLPDGIYSIKYSIAPAYENFIEKSIMRVDKLLEKFSEAFMKLDMMECDLAIKTQSKVDLTSIDFFIQGAIAAANNCALTDAIKLYNQADKMLNAFIRNNCGCSGNNYITQRY